MKVRELIAALQQMDQNARVVVDGYEGGLDDPLPPEVVRIRPDVNHGMTVYGWHEEDDTGPELAVVISRPRG